MKTKTWGHCNVRRGYVFHAVLLWAVSVTLCTVHSVYLAVELSFFFYNCPNLQIAAAQQYNLKMPWSFP